MDYKMDGKFMTDDIERKRFEEAYTSLDFSGEMSTWTGRWKYLHSHVDALWKGWLSRAALAKQDMDAANVLIKSQQTTIHELREEIVELEKMVYVPGVRKCAKCNCQLVSNYLCAERERAKQDMQDLVGELKALPAIKNDMAYRAAIEEAISIVKGKMG